MDKPRIEIKSPALTEHSHTAVIYGPLNDVMCRVEWRGQMIHAYRMQGSVADILRMIADTVEALPEQVVECLTLTVEACNG